MSTNRSSVCSPDGGPRTSRAVSSRLCETVECDFEEDQLTSTSFVDALQHVLLFADWQARGAAPCVCKTWRDALLAEDKNDSHWQWLCERLRDEHRLYVPTGFCPSTDGWRAHFDKLWQQRNLWKVDEKAAEAIAAAEVDEAWRPQQQLSEQTFSVSVAVRFRPAVATAGGKDAATAEGDAVVMPLHQRVAMVRAKHGCSQAKAMRIVMKQEAAAKKRSGGAETEVELDECTVAVGKAPTQSSLAALEARKKAAEEAHLAAEDSEEMELKRRLKPHIYGVSASPSPPPLLLPLHLLSSLLLASSLPSPLPLLTRDKGSSVPRLLLASSTPSPPAPPPTPSPPTLHPPLSPAQERVPSLASPTLQTATRPADLKTEPPWPCPRTAWRPPSSIASPRRKSPKAGAQRPRVAAAYWREAATWQRAGAWRSLHLSHWGRES